MRRFLIGIMAVAATVLGTAAGAQAAQLAAVRQASPRPPSRSQIAAAITHARRSRYLWATVNICLPKPRHGGVIGVRGEMPALGFRATLGMTIQLQQYASSGKRFISVAGSTATRTVTLGNLTHGIHQDGAEFPFSMDTPLLRAEVTFTWTLDGHRLLRLSRATTSDHPSAAYGEPVGHSAASCRL